ncbi:MAG: Endonuclease 4 [Chlamydiae bacterium]|nr:Endonuclease 4 [Chlamydiota bacterium]
MSTSAEKLLIGAHTSAAGGVHNALLEGKEIGATTIQLFTSNQKRWQGKILGREDIDLWEKALQETGLQKIMSHDSYLINLGAPNPEVLEKSHKAFREEAERCVQLGITSLNFHPGAALQDDPQDCLDCICESLLEVEDVVAGSPTCLLLEATAGQGSTVGHSFEQLAYIIGKVKHKIPIGVCIDTCHIFAAGYDIRDKKAWDKTLDEFDRVVGSEYLQAFHVNDSLKGLGSRIDRHQPLGEGLIGMDCFKVLMQNPRTREIPKYLETPGGPKAWVGEIQMLREFANHKR